MTDTKIQNPNQKINQKHKINGKKIQTMSLRQRGQRPSESTNEGSSGGYGGYGASPPPAASSSGGGGVTTNSNPYGRTTSGGYYGASPPSSSGSGYNTSTSAAAAVGVGIGIGGVASNNYAAATTPRQPSSGYPNNNASSAAGYGGGAYNQATAAAAAVASPYASSSAGYPPSAAAGTPAAYSAAGYGGGGNSQIIMGGSRSINFDSNNSSSAYGGNNTITTAGAGAGYGGYSVGGGSSPSPTTNNPFQTTKKSSSFSFNLGSITNNILPLLLGLTICTLTATTFHFRRTMLITQSQITLSKQTMERHHQHSTQKAHSNREQIDTERSQLLDTNTRLESQINKLTILYQERSNRHSGLIDELNAKEKEKQSILKKIDHTKYALEDTSEELEKYTSMSEGKKEVELYSKKREGALWDVVGRLESKIGRESWRETEEW